MSKEHYFRQCRLKKLTEKGYLEQTSYIPEPFCVVGKIIKLRSENIWVDGWQVIEASDVRVEDSDLPDLHKEIRGHRKNTGDSMEKVKD